MKNKKSNFVVQISQPTNMSKINFSTQNIYLNITFLKRTDPSPVTFFIQGYFMQKLGAIFWKHF